MRQRVNEKSDVVVGYQARHTGEEEYTHKISHQPPEQHGQANITAQCNRQIPTVLPHNDRVAFKVRYHA